ncbi:MAG: HPr kinase/phosphatase C-terminal domain-containing protein [Pseudomonadota bacterium]
MLEHMHANLIAINGKGVLISGPSGSGKTLLALHLFRRCYHASIDVCWIADDQVVLEMRDKQLIGTAPSTIKGKIEIRGFGIVDAPLPQLQSVPVSLHISLEPETKMVRMWDGQMTNISGVEVRTLALSTANVEAAGNAVLAMLGHPIWI